MIATANPAEPGTYTVSLTKREVELLICALRREQQAGARERVVAGTVEGIFDRVFGYHPHEGGV